LPLSHCDLKTLAFLLFPLSSTHSVLSNSKM
jgi:hypothetical protein